MNLVFKKLVKLIYSSLLTADSYIRMLILVRALGVRHEYDHSVFQREKSLALSTNAHLPVTNDRVT